MNGEVFSGSYDPQDVVFLLKVIEMEPTPLAERERRIQSGQAHYSEMIGHESAPSAPYLQVFHQALNDGGPDLARHLAALAAIIASGRRGPLTLVSLARAGVPVGILLKRILEQYFQRETQHWSISIIRDRGLDERALDHILGPGGRPDSSIIFVDGWTGKGVIARELRRAVADYNRSRRAGVSPDLHVLTDLCGEAGVAAGGDDFLVPSSILNSIVSGLISRTILNRDFLGPDDFHGCLYYRHLAPQDLSRWFLDRVMAELARLDSASPIRRLRAEPLSPARRQTLGRDSQAFVERMQARLGQADVNHIKPGLGEATRVLLRRAPEALYLRNPGEPQVRHLELLAREKGVPVWGDPELPYRAAAIIRNVENA